MVLYIYTVDIEFKSLRTFEQSSHCVGERLYKETAQTFIHNSLWFCKLSVVWCVMKYLVYDEYINTCTDFYLVIYCYILRLKWLYMSSFVCRLENFIILHVCYSISLFIKLISAIQIHNILYI